MRMSDIEINTINKLDFLLVTLYLFTELGRDEVSISEFQESVHKIQQIIPLGYSFSERFLLSIDLLVDLKELDYKGYIRDYHYRLDGLLPKRFLALTVLGQGRGKSKLQMLSDDVSENLKRIIESAIKNYKERWRLWVR
jgi:hypothetical protein